MRADVFHGKQLVADSKHGDSPRADPDFSPFIFGEIGEFSDVDFALLGVTQNRFPFL